MNLVPFISLSQVARAAWPEGRGGMAYSKSCAGEAVNGSKPAGGRV